MAKPKYSGPKLKKFLLSMKAQTFKEISSIARKKGFTVTREINDALEIYVQAIKDQEKDEKQPEPEQRTSLLHRNNMNDSL